MSFFAEGNPPINSTTGIVAAPSTASLIAELDSTQLGTVNYAVGQEQNFNVRAILGASTTAVWQVEHAISTALASPIDTVFVYSATGQSGQYGWVFRLQKDSRIRARLNSTAANATAFLQAEALV